MGSRPKHQPSPQVPQRKQLPAPSAGEAKPCPRRLLGIDGESDSQHPLWRLSLLDLEHVEGWSWALDEAAIRKIVAFLAAMERLTWKEVRAQQTGGRRRGAKHKFIPADHLCHIAQRRLGELQLDDFDELFRFRLGNFERLWGVIREGVFYAIWWDPDHKVCPGKDKDLQVPRKAVRPASREAWRAASGT